MVESLYIAVRTDSLYKADYVKVKHSQLSFRKKELTNTKM